MRNKIKMIVGEDVDIEYLDIDELEATCWIVGHSVLGYLDNSTMTLKLSDIGRKTFAKIISIDEETGRIELKSFYF